MAFTEQGVARLSSVLNSPRAIQVNIAIMRALVELRQLLASHEDLARKTAGMESKYDAQFRVEIDGLRQLIAAPLRPHRKIGFHVKEPRATYKTRTGPRVRPAWS